MRAWTVLLFALLALTLAQEESCLGRCENGYDSQKQCQCDSMCKYYRSCCSDYEPVCALLTRGDTFVMAEDEDELFWASTPSPSPASRPWARPTRPPTLDFGSKRQQQQGGVLEMAQASPPILQSSSGQGVPATEPPGTDPETTAAPAPAPTEAPDPDAAVCSGRPFDSFMQVKNGSVFAFRGEYFFELDHKTVLPGYPKLIKDVWGISGPIDAAFTRYNCQGKTYIFKGSRYWRFDNGVLDDDYPRDISVGFDTIPDHVDAAFALPAPGHNGREKVYFFKGDQYYTYEFLHQPSHAECIAMSERSPSALFRRYNDVYYNHYQSFLSNLFSDFPRHHDKHRFIDKDWKGLKSPIDAVMTGRMYVPSWRAPRRRNDYRLDQQDQQWGQPWGQPWGRRRQSRSPFWGSMAEQGMNMGQEMAERGMEMGLRLAERRMALEERLRQDWDRTWDQDRDQDRRRDGYQQNNRGNYDSRRDGPFWPPIGGYEPIQTVYFFKGESYYRVDLRTRRVDPAIPPYPRSIAKYWLGCSDTSGAEK